MKRITTLLTFAAILSFSNLLGQDNTILIQPDSTITYFFTEEGDSTPLNKTVFLNVNCKTSEINLVNHDGSWNNIELTSAKNHNAYSSYEFNYEWNTNTWIPTDYNVKEYEADMLLNENDYNFDLNTETWLCNSETKYYYNTHKAKDSVLYYFNDFKTNTLVLLNKEIWTNSYNLPVYATYLELSGKKGWQIKGKTEYQYGEENHDIIEKLYSYNTNFELKQKIYTDKDSNGKISKREIFNWQSETKEWTQAVYSDNKDSNSNLLTRTLIY